MGIVRSAQATFEGRPSFLDQYVLDLGADTDRSKRADALFFMYTNRRRTSMTISE